MVTNSHAGVDTRYVCKHAEEEEVAATLLLRLSSAMHEPVPVRGTICLPTADHSCAPLLHRFVAAG